MTHWRFSWENPRSILIEGSATFTIAMSRTTMNWTALRSASASHFLLSVATIGLQSFHCVRKTCNLAEITCLLQANTSQEQAEWLSSSHGEALRAVLPGRPRPRRHRRSLGAARRPGADPRPE